MSVENGTFGADAYVAFGGVFDTAEASAKAACHHIFERHFAFNFSLLCNLRYSLHHRHRTATTDEVERLFGECRMDCDETFDAFRAVFGSDMHDADFCEFVYQKEVFSRTGTDEEFYLYVALAEFASEIKERCTSDSTSYEENLLRLVVVIAEAVAEREHDVERLSFVHRNEGFGTMAGTANEEIKSVGLEVYVVNRNGTAEKHSLSGNLYLNKLSGFHGRKRIAVGGGYTQSRVVRIEPKIFGNYKVFNLLHFKKSLNVSIYSECRRKLSQTASFEIGVGLHHKITNFYVKVSTQNCNLTLFL